MMYLLLRDNKQSGPYSLDELKVKGLKAYDLVWVEGRSAAWRYPSEIGELSSFAPAVEEQPFDRFYKKPAAAKTADTVAVTMTQPVSTSNPVTKRTIYVTMPGGIAAKEVVREITPVREVVREIVPVREPVTPVYEPVAPVRETMPVRENRSYMRESVTEILPPLPGRKPARIWLPVAIGAAVLVLLAAGIFIGLSIQKDAPANFKLASRTSRDKEQQPIRTTAQQLPVSPATNSAGGAANASNTGNGQAASMLTTANAPGTDRPVNKPRMTVPKQKAMESKPQSALVTTVVADSPAASSTVIHREAVHRTDAVQSQPVDEHESLKTALANQISVGTNKYEVGTFGGIHNLQVTVTNRSAYSLDLVVVVVSYIQANKKTYKTENLYFRGIGPGSALMLEAPKSSRGVNIRYKVTSINSKELGLSEPGI
jgi:hypothetical protein